MVAMLASVLMCAILIEDVISGSLVHMDPFDLTVLDGSTDIPHQ